MAKLMGVLKASGDFIKSHFSEVAAGAGGVALGAGVGYIAGHKISRKTSSRRKKSKNRSIRKRSHSHSRKLKFGSKAYRKKYLGHKRKRHTPYTAGKRKDTSHRRIRYTKKGQPYVILRNGRARFIKASSASSSYKRKGGKY